jgi:predicted ester cyclase
LFPADSVMWGVGRPDVSSRGPEEFRVFYQAMRKTFSDMRIELEGIVQGGDTAYTRFTVTATHSGEGLGMVPSGKTIKLVGMCALRAENGKIVEGWNVWDQMGLARELGVLSESALAIFPQRCKAENRNWELEKRTARRGDLADKGAQRAALLHFLWRAIRSGGQSSGLSRRRGGRGPGSRRWRRR